MKNLPSLETELLNLKRNIARDDDKLSELESYFYEIGGVCCPSCGVPGYSELLSKRERRESRVKEIIKRLQKTETLAHLRDIKANNI